MKRSLLVATAFVASTSLIASFGSAAVRPAAQCPNSCDPAYDTNYPANSCCFVVDKSSKAPTFGTSQLLCSPENTCTNCEGDTKFFVRIGSCIDPQQIHTEWNTGQSDGQFDGGGTAHKAHSVRCESGDIPLTIDVSYGNCTYHASEALLCGC